MRLMLRRATYWISFSADKSETSGGASFFDMSARKSGEVMNVSCLRMTFTALSTTAQLACCSRGVMRSTMDTASFSSRAWYETIESRMKTCPHSVHSFSAASSLNRFCVSMWNTGCAAMESISASDATALATTIGLASPTMSFSTSMNPRSSTNSGEMSKSLATQIAAVLRTYGSSSFSARAKGSQRYSVILSTRMQPMVRTASARISGDGSEASFTNVLTAISARSGCVLA
mmetsp:Transcript_21328/g.60049  ORF Transcript_21328/g.60049 Transcript_21328/m.60049 type:complete len:232 (-) Transcript_21328:244-939(-)